ncbi:acetate kinase [Nocardioides sp. AE5]|uniref:acetate/propionate family kinase n=1 Tax=Nocardioides sp. AE5 TaxID=2962573 RepID=UPI0028813A5C|nr:acetate kinase [Nocardioides sp. AE5]MDT0203812.1 acetate kinase [Nocardioides sp. AE5]
MSGAPHVLVVNAGSSSLKYSLVDATTGASPGGGLVERISEQVGTVIHEGPEGEVRIEGAVADHEAAFALALAAFEEHGPSLAAYDVVAVGHRAVHGGDRFSAPVRVTDEVCRAIEDLVPLAPLHNPANLEGIAGARALFPDLPHVAVFDTAFHQSLPEHAWTYAVPRSWASEHAIRRYGFHGTSFSFVSRAAAELLGKPLEETNLIVAHLGNGASITAVRGGASVETSMGMTPLEGLVMGTRSGDVDPALHAHLHRELGLSLDEIDTELNRNSGLKGLAGENDFREVLRMRTDGDEGACLAFDVYCHRLRKYVGAYYAVLGRVDAVVFTGGVGENAAPVRAESLAGLAELGITVDAERNAAPNGEPRAISPDGSRVAVLVVPTDEEWEIARQAVEVIGAS